MTSHAIMTGAVWRKWIVWAKRTLLLLGCSTLVYCATILLSSRYYQTLAGKQLRDPRHKRASRTGSSQVALRLAHEPPKVIRESAVIGRIEIPEVGLSAMIGEGATPTVLRVAVGHMPETALPWEAGNVGLVAHRDTFFRRLGEIKIGDAIRITAPGSEFSYRVTFTDIVDPTEIWVLQPATGNTLTLITCYPFHFIGAAPKRFVVRARRLENECDR